MNKIWFAAEDNQACWRHFGDSQWRRMESGQIKVLGTTDISRWQKHRSWFKANFSSKTARASVCIGNYQFCPHWQTGVQYGIVCMRKRRHEEVKSQFLWPRPHPCLIPSGGCFPGRGEKHSGGEGKRAQSLDSTKQPKSWHPTKQTKSLKQPDNLRPGYNWTTETPNSTKQILYPTKQPKPWIQSNNWSPRSNKTTKVLYTTKQPKPSIQPIDQIPRSNQKTNVLDPTWGES